MEVRFQTQTSGTPRTKIGSTLVGIINAEGIAGLYSGISASTLRQLTYSTVRFGIYEELKHHVPPDASFLTLCGIASISGFAGGVAGNAADVLNVRMQNDTSLPIYERRNYKNVIDGLVRMTSDEGFRSWFRGWLPNSGRAALATTAQLASYDATKAWMIKRLAVEDSLGTQLSASFVAGLTAATSTSPLDVVKTKLMSANSQQGTLQILRDITAQEGARWMFKGWVPSFLRQAP
jgi:dicarboxylate transporter 10